MDDLLGQTLGQYEILELIGEGGMATVYRARQPRLQRDVAVKVLLSEIAADPTFRERFEREAQSIANLRHPNILAVHDYGETEAGLPYLVVEYVEAGTLRDRLEGLPASPPSVPPSGGEAGGALSLQEIVEIVAQMAEALDYAHQQGVVHRDVKPNNILLTRDGRPLLADFGLVKPIESDRRLTATGIVLGTPDYVAPEQARGLPLDGRTDIYALGVMLFEMLTGRHPFDGETPVSVIVKHVTDPMPIPSGINPDIPPALDAIVARATAKSPEERYQRAGELARALREALVSGPASESAAERATPAVTPEVSAPVAAPTPAPSAPQPWYRQARVWVGLTVALVLALAVVALALRSGPSVGDQEPAGAAVVPTAASGEVLILVARFKAEEGSAFYDVSQRIYDKISTDLRQLDEGEVSVYQVPEVIESSEAARALGERYGAATVIWGFYDDIGISPNLEAVGQPEESPLSVGLERFNLDVGEAVNFKLYIAKDLPEELSFLTAMSLVQTFMLQGRLDKTMIYMGLAAENLPADPQFRGGGEMVFFLQGMMALFQGELEGAVANLDQAIALNPERAVFYTMRALAQLQRQALDRAMADLARAITLAPRDPLAYTIKGAVELMTGDLDAAADTYARIVELEPDSVSGQFLRGWVAFEIGDLTLALTAFDRVEEIVPQLSAIPMIPLSRGLVYEKMGQSERAAADYARALEWDVSPDATIEMVGSITRDQFPSYSYLFACTTYQGREESEQALASCDQALQVDPAYADALWKRGQLYAAQGDWEAAVADYNAAIAADARWPWVYYLRAQALIELGRTDEAQADLALALQLDPVDELRQKIEKLRGES